MNFNPSKSPSISISHLKIHLGLLLIWILLGSGLRLLNLDGKPPWTDEIATLVFSLGNSFKTVPLSQAIDIETLLTPLKPNSQGSFQSVFQYLMDESTHPPIYFWLTHGWLKLFPIQDGLVSLWGARSLAVCFGIMTIPSIFLLSYLSFNSLIASQISAALMAFSPYGIYLSQEARHYTLPLLLIIISLGYLTIAIRKITQHSSLDFGFIFTWVIINGLGLAVHYFFGLVIVAEALTLLSFTVISHDLRLKLNLSSIIPFWQPLLGLAMGTLLTIIIWIPAWQSIPDDPLTDWVQPRRMNSFYEPITRLIVWIITMVSLLPVEHHQGAIAVVFAIILIAFSSWLFLRFRRGIIQQYKQPQSQLGIQILGRFFIISLSLIIVITYGFSHDLTLAARYQFIYFPSAIALLAAGIVPYWQKPIIFSQVKQFSLKNIERNSILFTLVTMSFIGAIVVISNLGYQKPDRSDIVAQTLIKEYQIFQSQTPVLLATTYKTHEQTSELIAIGRELKLKSQHPQELQNIRFLLAPKSRNLPTATNSLHQTVDTLPRPFDLWLINFSAPEELAARNCQEMIQSRYRTSGYRYRRYQCLKRTNS